MLHKHNKLYQPQTIPKLVMAAFNFVFVLLLGLCVVEGRVFQGRVLNGTGNEIPQLCVAQSVTAVSCADAPSGEDADGLLPHPDDCRLFYYCLSPELPPVCRQCPGDLYFNPEKRVCDNSKFSGCLQPSLFV